MGSTRRAIGSTRKLNSGRYQVRFTDPYGERRTGGTYATKALAESELGRIIRAIEGGTWTPQGIKSEGVPSTKVTLRDVGDKWRSIRVSKRGMSLSPRTLSEYERLVSSTLSELADRPIRTITSSQVERWWAEQHKRAPNQASKAYKHLNQLCEYAIKQGILQLNPCQVEGAANYKPATMPEVPTIEQVRIMTDVAEYPWKAFYTMAAWGGFRKGELLELRRKDLEEVEIDGATWWAVRIRRGVIWQKAQAIVKEPKTAAGIREVLLPEFTSEAINAHLKAIPLGPEQLLFPNLLNPSKHQGEFEMRDTWRRVQEASGFKGRFHSLRGFAATQYGLMGATAVELMARFGHRNIETAMRYQRTTGRDVALIRGIQG